ncbi:hypothetical protein [Comamonas thiooxydans]|uniref:hypothetical protein n=1 Tax=Comamonas thiooxydans TaxID=363952 RepID=UPI0015A75029|nr:hypothetical protein [Comamonas thiooxydans]
MDLPAGITDTGNAAIVDTESTDPGNPNPGADVPTLDVSNPGNVNEGSDAKFDITLGKAVDAETTITFKLGGDIESDDIGTPVVTIGGTAVTLVNNGNGIYSFQVPAGTTGGIVVTVPTHDDAVFEGSEADARSHAERQDRQRRGSARRHHRHRQRRHRRHRKHGSGQPQSGR